MSLPILLLCVVTLFPDMTPIQVARFETEKDCYIFATKLDASTSVALTLTCVVDI